MVDDGTRWVPTLELWQGASRNFAVDYAEAPNIAFDRGMTIHETGWMQEAGMTPLHIIVAATRNAARACTMEGELGTLEAGKLADVLVVDGDPVEDLQALTRPRLVLREGTPIQPGRAGIAACVRTGSHAHYLDPAASDGEATW